MKQQELRYGNLIHGVYENNQDEEITEVVKFLGYDPHELWYWVDGSGNAERYSSFDPIPLTEEWLERFGFNWLENPMYCNKKQWLLHVTRKTDSQSEINRDGTWFDGIGDYSWMPNSTKPKTMVVNTLCRGNYVCSAVEYVHQLQNLYFALTNEELTIK